MAVSTHQSFKKYRRAQNLIASSYFGNHKTKNAFMVDEKYSYILKDRDNWHWNIILQGVADYVEAQKGNSKGKDAYPIHKYIHHGLSSQAMLFNLFGEPVIKNDYAFFQEVFGFADILIGSDYELKFEHSDRKTFKELSQQPTSFDFAIIPHKGNDLKSIFVEAKYVEAGFGRCSAIVNGECDGLSPAGDPEGCYLTSKGRTYWDIMEKHKLDKPFLDSPICPFVIYYQFYRELMFALENNGYFVLLIDKRNPVFQKQTPKGDRGLIPVLMKYLPAHIQKEIKVIYIQDVVPLLEKHRYTWAGEFRKKYGM